MRRKRQKPKAATKTSRRVVTYSGGKLVRKGRILINTGQHGRNGVRRSH